MKIYKMKIALRGVSPMVWRRLLVPGVTSLATLHEAIQIVNGWDNDYLHLFHIYGVNYGIHYPGGLSFHKDAHDVCVDDFEFDEGDKFFYEYNFFEDQVIDIRIEAIVENQQANLFVRCLKGNGMPGVSKYDAHSAAYDLIKDIVKSNWNMTCGEVRQRLEAIDALKFRQRHINHRLSAELTPA